MVRPAQPRAIRVYLLPAERAIPADYITCPAPTLRRRISVIGVGVAIDVRPGLGQPSRRAGSNLMVGPSRRACLRVPLTGQTPICLLVVDQGRSGVADLGWPSTLPPQGGLRMSSPIVAQSEPYSVELEAGKNYAWCACGRSANQPWCDGSHRETEFSPFVWKAEKTETVFLCGCKSTGDSPYCDGTHNLL